MLPAAALQSLVWLLVAHWLRGSGVAYRGLAALAPLGVSAAVALGLINAIVATEFGEPWKLRMEDVTEWWGVLIVVLGFLALAAMWRRAGLCIQLTESANTSQDPPGRQTSHTQPS